MSNQTIVVCDTCHAPTKSQRQCKRRTCMTHPYCWQHLQSIMHLQVKDSTIPGAGKGLFAAKLPGKNKQKRVVFRANQIIAPYTGEKLTKKQLDQRYPGDTLGQYVLQLSKDRYIDARKTDSSVARYANSCQKTSKKCNAKLANNTGNLKVKPNVNIKEGEEILTSYGKEYLFHSNKKKK